MGKWTESKKLSESEKVNILKDEFGYQMKRQQTQLYIIYFSLVLIGGFLLWQ